MNEADLLKLYQHIGSRVKLRRSMLKLAQQDVANSLNISVTLLDQIERGNVRITAYILLRFARFSGSPIIWFFSGLPPIDGSGKPEDGKSNVIPVVFTKLIKQSQAAKLRKAA